MQRAYRDGLDMGQLQYLEAHATATQVGDATELNTVAEVLKASCPPGGKSPSPASRPTSATPWSRPAWPASSRSCWPCSTA